LQFDFRLFEYQGRVLARLYLELAVLIAHVLILSHQIGNLYLGQRSSRYARINYAPGSGSAGVTWPNPLNPAGVPVTAAIRVADSDNDGYDDIVTFFYE